MPIKKIVAVRRKVGLSPEEFRDGYENHHARMAVELFGHLWLGYRRNYITTGDSFEGARRAYALSGGSYLSGHSAADAFGFDAISEFILRDEAALAEMNRIAVENNDKIEKDEKRWFDQAHSWLVTCETVEADLTGRATAKA